MRFALLGCGQAASNHAKAVRKIGSKVVAVLGSDETRVAAFAKEHNIPNSYTDFDTLFKQEQIDAVIIASAPSMHTDHVVRASNYVDVIVVEKPLVANVHDLKKIQDIAAKPDKSISVVYQHRFNKSFQLLKKALEQYQGKILHIDLKLSQFRTKEYFRGWRLDTAKSGGGVIISNGIHWLSLLGNLFGHDATVEHTHKQTKYAGGEDLATLHLSYDGIPVQVFISRITSSREPTLTIYGEDRVWEITRSSYKELPSMQTRTQQMLYYLKARLPIAFTVKRNRHIGTYADVLKAVVKLNKEKRTSLFFKEAVKDIQFINKIYDTLLMD